MENLNAKIDYNKKAKSLWESEWLFRNGGDDEMDKDTVVAVCSLLSLVVSIIALVAA
ncbi:hypothetical protein [Peribacillus frigoritolerans]|uniref:hypothetical protein n=1 Tax=Peribacillus frigoritolerans TaxID=450367 RepID=UPI00203D616F|nr:hypothetical protein [Peribacillus frigoritolerans]MCM3169442.1 hypothetical protein [Peribacillus frigoritolerans]